MDTDPACDGLASAYVESAYESNRPSLHRYLTSVTRDAALAEDLVQDAFLRLTVEANAGRFPDDPAAWLHRVGHNLAMSAGRRRSVATRPYRALERSDDPASPEDVIVGSERMHELEDVLVDLEPVTRRPWRWRRWGTTPMPSPGRSAGPMAPPGRCSVAFAPRSGRRSPLPPSRSRHDVRPTPVPIIRGEVVRDGDRGAMVGREGELARLDDALERAG
jgi:RNA polymerase sigma factor (sigma-70 family)